MRSFVKRLLSREARFLWIVFESTARSRAENALASVCFDGFARKVFIAARMFFFRFSFSPFLRLDCLKAFFADFVTGILVVVLATRANYT